VIGEQLVLWGIGTSRPILPRSGETKTPEYTVLNVRQKIPLLVDGETSRSARALRAALANKPKASAYS
jgi:glutathione S-transferase